MREELYRAIIKQENGEDVVLEGNLVAAVNNGNFHMIGEATEENLQNLIYASVYYIIRAIRDKENCTVLKAIDKCLSYTEYIIGLLIRTLREDEVKRPEIMKDVHDMIADFAVSVGKEESSGTGYPIESVFEQFMKSVLFSCSIELVLEYNADIDFIYDIIDSATDKFRKEFQTNEEESKYVLVGSNWKGKRQEVEAKVVSVVTDDGVGILGEPFKYNLAQLGIFTLAAIGEMYLDRGTEQDRVEAAMKEIYDNAMEIVRKRFEEDSK